MRILTLTVALTIGLLPAVSFGQQTQIVMPKNKYKTSDDIQLGNKAAAETEQQFPILNDPTTTRYVRSVGERLVAAIPAEFQHPEFTYSFKVVNASDINAFALPGGPMYVDRGMIQTARNEGEMAGVMAHEISHVALRHATAQATKQGSLGNQLGMLGMILGGAVVGGQGGAQLGMLGAQAWMTKYSREYETQADLLGARIMAAAGYDPRDLANVFQTLASQGGSGAPQWMSSHPDPGNRYQKINREAQFLQVSGTPIKMTAGFERTRSRLGGMSPAPSMQEIQAEYQRTGRVPGAGNSGGYGGYPSGSTRSQDTMAGARYSRSVEGPSAQMRDFSSGNWISLSVPANWRDFASQGQVTFAPQGAYGDQGITHGAMIGVKQSNTRDALQATQASINELVQGNQYLRQQGSIARSSLSGLPAYVARLSGQSEITGQTEVVTVYSTLMKSGELFYIATVAPQAESYRYDAAFKTLLNSLRLNE